MSKITKAYNNTELLKALEGRDEALSDIKYLMNEYNNTDEDYKRIERFKSLTQFQQDLLYLSSQQSVYDIASLYGVSATILYKYLRKIYKILEGKDE